MPFKELDVSQDVLCAHVYLLIAMSSFATLFISRRDYNVLNNTEGGRNFELEKYSLVCFALFCLVKRIIEYFAKEWSEQKVSISDNVGLYSTYQKYIMIGAPNSYPFGEKWTWVFYQKNLQKSKHFFYEK